MFYIWFITAITLGIIEILTTNLVSIWFALSALVSMIISMFTDNIIIQIGVFVVFGIILMFITKRLYKKTKKEDTCTNLDRIIGMKGIVTEDITKDNIGEVKVDGKKWSAYSDTTITKGEVVKVLSINSVKIKVEKWRD